MSENQPLGTRLKGDLMNNFAVSVSAVLLAIIALFAFSQIDDSATGRVLLALNIAVFIPYAYEQFWPDKYSSTAAAVWTISAALITIGIFIGVYQFVPITVSGEYTAGIAFVVTVVIQYAIAVLFMRTRQTA